LSTPRIATTRSTLRPQADPDENLGRYPKPSKPAGKLVRTVVEFPVRERRAALLKRDRIRGAVFLSLHQLMETPVGSGRPPVSPTIACSSG